MTSQIPAIEALHVTRRYGNTVALDNVSFTVPQHGIVGLLGRNGAGKTTLMSILTGQDRADAGSVQVLGHNPYEHPATLGQITFIRDNQRYPEDYKLRHALEAASIFHEHWDQALADRLVDLFRLPTKTGIRKFSRGQLSSVGITIGLASRAPITFFDEPYLGLDATARQHFYDTLLADYAEHPRTILLSTHLIDEMESLLERVVVLDQGRVVLDTDVAEAKAQYCQLAGMRGAVEGVVGSSAVLRRHEVGGLLSVVVASPLTEHMQQAAKAAGVEASPVSLQQIVAALGAADQDVAAA